MLIHRIIKPWNISFKAFLLLFCFGLTFSNAQNTLTKEVEANAIETITIKGNQIFNVSVVSTETDYVTILSILDGEYQNNYQIATKLDQNELILSLEYMSFEDIPDDKRNAHKVIAAELKLQIPNNLNLNIFSDIGSVIAKGSYNTLSIELVQGYCTADALSKSATINTIEGDINVITDDAVIRTASKNGKVSTESLNSSEYQWNLTSINGDITVIKKE
ncbi:MAG: hypothetical protein AAFX55_14310 [Bacteroidota bacterium]